MMTNTPAQRGCAQFPRANRAPKLISVAQTHACEDAMPERLRSDESLGGAGGTGGFVVIKVVC